MKFSRLIVPHVLVALAAGAYTYFNIHERLFVDTLGLGCGCANGFNTNSLTFLFWLLILSAFTLGLMIASRGQSRKLRTIYIITSILVFIYFSIRLFIRNNTWL